MGFLDKVSAKVADQCKISVPASYEITAKSIVSSKFIVIVAAIVYITKEKIITEGRHLTPHQVFGVGRMTIQHPVKSCNPLSNSCRDNFSAMDQLPYCSQYKGESKTEQFPCIFRDGFSLYPPTEVPGTMFVPTYISTLHQKRNCSPEAKNNYQCDHLFLTTHSEDHFVADIEKFTIMVDHSFNALMGDGSMKTGGRGGKDNGKVTVGTEKDLVQSLQMEAAKKDRSAVQIASGILSYPILKKDRKDRRLGALQDAAGSTNGLKAVAKVLQQHGSNVSKYDIPESHESRIQEYPSVVRTHFGDVIAVGDLVKLAAPHLGHDVFDQRRPYGESLRRDGGHITIAVHYSNKVKNKLLPQSPPNYEVSAAFTPLTEYKHMHVVEASDGQSRILQDVHGILITVGVVGHFYIIDYVAVVTALTIIITSLLQAITSIDKYLTKTMATSSIFGKSTGDVSSHSHEDMKKILSMDQWEEVMVQSKKLGGLVCALVPVVDAGGD